MGLFATTSRKSSGTTGGKSQEMSERLRQKLPARFEAVGEALSAGSDARAACTVVGRDLARDGVDLSEALHGLWSTFALVVDREPDFEATRALGIAWSDETLGYLHEVSCENPLTGLATLAHLRGRLAEIQRGADSRGDGGGTHALVVVDVPQLAGASRHDQLGSSLVMARVASQVRLVFEGEESIGEASPSRLLVLAERNENLGTRVGTLRELLAEVTPRATVVRVWIEGLPASPSATSTLLDELART